MRGPLESEEFSFTLTSLTLPIAGHRIAPLARYEHRVSSQTTVGHEPASIGLIASLGLAWLLLVALSLSLTGARRRLDPRHGALAAAAVFVLLLGTTGGISGLIAWGVTPQIRTWSRLAVFVAFFALAAVGLLLDRARRHSDLHPSGRWVLGVALAALVLVGLADQTSGATIPDYAGAAARSRSDQALVAAAQRSLPPGSMVFQLPYVPFPETPPVVGVGAYDLARPYLTPTTYAGASARCAVVRTTGRRNWPVPIRPCSCPGSQRPGSARSMSTAAGTAIGLPASRPSSVGSWGAANREPGRPGVAVRPAPVHARAPCAARCGRARGPRARGPAPGPRRGRSRRLHPRAAGRLPRLALRDGPAGHDAPGEPRRPIARRRPLDPLLRPGGAPVPVLVGYPDGSSSRVAVGSTPVPLRRVVRLPAGSSAVTVTTDGFPFPAGAGGVAAFVQLRDLTLLDPALARTT